MSMFKVQIRRDIGLHVKPEAEALDGKTYNFIFGWTMDKNDKYPGEVAYIPRDTSYPVDAPIWIASGDLVET